MEKEVNWGIQSTLYASIFYHLAVFDPFLSVRLKAVSPLAAAGEWKDVAHVIVIFFFMAVGVLQEILKNKDFNPLRLLNRFLYTVCCSRQMRPWHISLWKLARNLRAC